MSINTNPEIYCDTIGDIFSHPDLIYFLSKYYKSKTGKRLRIRLQTGGVKSFSQEYCDFIRATFTDRTDMEEFLRFIREELLTSEDLHPRIREKYSSDELIVTLLAFDEINDQLLAFNRFSITGVFQTKIVDILRESYTRQSIIGSDDEDEVTENYPTVYYALERACDYGIPINEDGEIILGLGEGKEGQRSVTLGGNEDIFEFDTLGNHIRSTAVAIVEKGKEVLVTRTQIIQKIQLLERIFIFHNSDNDVLSEDDEQYYHELYLEFASSKNLDPTNDDTLLQISFRQYILKMIEDLKEQLLNTQISDTTQVEKWKEKGIAPGISEDIENNKDATTKEREKDTLVIDKRK